MRPSRVAEELTAAGFDVVDVGNADHDDYATTTVLHDPAYDESGRTLGRGAPGLDGHRGHLASAAPCVVVVGADAPTVVHVQVSGSTAPPAPDETLETRSADQNICS